jgi:hypothetical protein
MNYHQLRADITAFLAAYLASDEQSLIFKFDKGSLEAHHRAVPVEHFCFVLYDYVQVLGLRAVDGG